MLFSAYKKALSKATLLCCTNFAETERFKELVLNRMISKGVITSALKRINFIQTSMVKRPEAVSVFTVFSNLCKRQVLYVLKYQPVTNRTRVYFSFSTLLPVKENVYKMIWE